MGHKTLIGGTAYEISGGKTLVGGTAYSIDKGKTLIDGTAYTIPFTVTITVTGTGAMNKVYIVHGSSIYYNPTTITANVGDPIGCYVRDCRGSASTITLNGTKVGGNDSAYQYNVVSDATINLYDSKSSNMYNRIGKITITDANA